MRYRSNTWYNTIHYSSNTWYNTVRYTATLHGRTLTKPAAKFEAHSHHSKTIRASHLIPLVSPPKIKKCSCNGTQRRILRTATLLAARILLLLGAPPPPCPQVCPIATAHCSRERNPTGHAALQEGVGI